MRICQAHWDELKSAIETRGLMRFVSNDGKQAADKIQAQLQAGLATELDKFDPLLNANFAIWSNALELGGMYLMGAHEDGTPYCPICESVKNNCYPADWWINHAAEDQLAKARELGLIPRERVQ